VTGSLTSSSRGSNHRWEGSEESNPGSPSPPIGPQRKHGINQSNSSLERSPGLGIPESPDVNINTSAGSGPRIPELMVYQNARHGSEQTVLLEIRRLEKKEGL
jgi:hypothetical protein